jgi:predicted methyltransferase
MSRFKLPLAAAALAACLSAPCLAADEPPPVKIDPDLVASLSSRPAADMARDVDRKPFDTLAFANIPLGARIAERIPGGGYYTRLLRAATGPDGHIYALSSPPRADRPNPLAALLADVHFANVTALPLAVTERALGLPQPVDVVWTSQNYHDLRNNLDSAGMKDFNRRVFEALGRGGIYIVIDHASAPGRGASDSRTLHRIDPETVKAEVIAAGFKLAATSDVLRNPADPHTASSSDASIRGKTDQFIFKFVKP